ncbi:MAG: DUF1924 domain-containing protein [Bacteriovorax sp.]|nr:DUF1924 domain-containing protein [Bacteriovorax sp.]
MKTIKIFFILLSIPSFCLANEEILQNFNLLAKKANSQFKSFSEMEGEKLYRNERVNSKNDKVSCMTCHTSNPKNEGLTRANKVIAPIAPVANPERFTDLAKVEKWFKRNCKDVLERECTVLEKGNFVKYMMSVK